SLVAAGEGGDFVTGGQRGLEKVRADEAGGAGDGQLHQFLPGTGRGTSEAGGGAPPRSRGSTAGPHHHVAARRGPPPRSVEDFRAVTIAGCLRVLRALRRRRRAALWSRRAAAPALPRAAPRRGRRARPIAS